MKFDEILSNEDLLDALYDMHFDDCTPIQERAIPIALQHKDLLACAQTGTGKTAAYLLPILEQIVDDGYPEDCVNCVVMAPTRELAQQIDQQLQGFCYYMPVTSLPIYGGTNGEAYEQQRKCLKKGADIIIATPGRLISHLSLGYVDLSKVSFFVLDEADRMLDMGFYDDIMQIISRTPKSRQTLLFSATMPDKIQQMATKILHEPEEIKLAVSKPADKIEQSAYIVYENQKTPILEKLLAEGEYNKVVIFASSKINVKNLAIALRKKKFKIAEMHSDLDQEKREEVMLNFKSGKVNIIVATDILSRGIDIDDIELVVNYDVPKEPEDYVHRIGRTARADRHGKAVTFVAERDHSKLRGIERLLEKEVPKAAVDAEFGETPAYNPNLKKHYHRKSNAKEKKNRFFSKRSKRANKIKSQTNQKKS